MDMVQEAYYQAWSSMASLKDNAKAFAWLVTILRRAVYREQRHQYRHKETLAALRQEDEASSDVNASRDVNEYSLIESYRVMESISPVQRETFLLHELHGFSYEEISQQLNIPLGTVTSRIARARDALRLIRSREADNIVKLQNVKRGDS